LSGGIIFYWIKGWRKRCFLKQIHVNPKVEICAFKNGEWLCVAGELIEDDRREARQSMLDDYSSLQKMEIRRFKPSMIGVKNIETDTFIEIICSQKKG